MRTFYIFIGACLLALVAGHSYVTSPTSRSNQAQTTTGCRGPSCTGPCDRPRAAITRAPIVAARGDSVTVNWPRNNHAGGFIRLSWAPTDQSDSHTAFDSGVQQISCHESGACHPDDASNPNGGDSGPSDGSSRACSTSIKIPAHLSDGKWTLQWAWFGGAFALGDYYSCVDYQISGGASGAAPAAVFKGGDYTYPGQQKCKFFNTDRLHQCVNEPCDNPLYTLNKERSGIPYMAASSSTQAPTQAPTKAPTQAPTKAPTQAPTKAPAQTPASTKAPTQTPAPTQSPSGNACTVGAMKCSGASSYQSCIGGRDGANFWAATQDCQATLFCNQDDSGDKSVVYCGRTQTYFDTPSATQSPATQVPSTVSGYCANIGYQQCTGGSTFKTCTRNAWSADQSCQAGLSCHASATGNNIYCY